MIYIPGSANTSAMSYSSSVRTFTESTPPISSFSSTADAHVTVTATTSSKISSQRRRLYPMPVSPSTTSAATSFLSAVYYLGFRRRACLLGALAAFQTVAVVTVILSALSEAGSGVGTRLPPSSIGSLRTDELNVTNSTYGELNRNLTWSVSDELNVTLIEMQSVLYGADCVESFLLHYEQFCNVAMTPGSDEIRQKRTNNRLNIYSDETANNPAAAAIATDAEDGQKQQQSMELCPCVPRQRLSKMLCIFLIVIRTRHCHTVMGFSWHIHLRCVPGDAPVAATLHCGIPLISRQFCNNQ